jgi:hypothetical protein
MHGERIKKKVILYWIVTPYVLVREARRYLRNVRYQLPECTVSPALQIPPGNPQNLYEDFKVFPMTAQ